MLFNVDDTVNVCGNLEAVGVADRLSVSGGVLGRRWALRRCDRVSQ